ncbi:MAG: S-layer homology domain-containing protein, partial [Oscillospiraceae bacterium]
VYNGTPIADSVFGTATFAPAWTGKLEYTYYNGNDTTGAPLASAPTNAGTYTVVAAIPASDAIYRGEATVPFAIGQAPLTIQAVDKFTYQHKALPATELVYTGFVNGEGASVLGANAYTAVHGVAAATVAGEFAIHVSGSTGNKNYSITTVGGKLTIQAVSPPKPVKPTPPTTAVTKPEIVAEPVAPANPGDPAKQLRVFSGELAPEDKTETLKQLAVPTGGVTVTQEVELQVSNDAGTTWTKATAADVKDGKVQVVLPIPAGTSPSTHTYVIYHFANGAATTPYSLDPAVSVVTNSLSATVSSLSPFVAVATPRGDGGGGGGGGGSSADTYYSIKATAGSGGSINSPERVRVRAGESAGFTITPNKGYEIADVLVNGKSIGAKSSYVFTAVHADQTIHATFKKAGHHNPQTDMSFADVQTGDWFYDAVMAATANGWFSGTSDTTFSPYTPTSRGMIATILHRMEGTPKADTASFDDVAADAYYANGIAWAEANGIVSGYGSGNYGPNDNVTREQLAAILYRYAGYKGYDVSKTAALDSFTDGKSVSGY